ncbi:hypothetical protein [Desulfofundulus thermosubterraneus]|nr:hypothetical protein [Desulfofundulus thermosubterraneus]
MATYRCAGGKNEIMLPAVAGTATIVAVWLPRWPVPCLTIWEDTVA